MKTNGVTPFVSDPKVFFFFVLSSCPHSQHHTSTQLTFSLSLVSFLFPLFFSLDSLSLSIFFSFDKPNLTLFFLPSFLLSCLYFADGNPLVVAGGSANFDGITGFGFFFFFLGGGREAGFGFNSNILMEFWTLAGVIGLRSFGFSWVSLWKRWRNSFLVFWATKHWVKESKEQMRLYGLSFWYFGY